MSHHPYMAAKFRLQKLIEDAIGRPLIIDNRKLNLTISQPGRPNCYEWKFTPQYPEFPSNTISTWTRDQRNACLQAIDTGALKVAAVEPTDSMDVDEQLNSPALSQSLSLQSPAIPDFPASSSCQDSSWHTKYASGHASSVRNGDTTPRPSLDPSSIKDRAVKMFQELGDEFQQERETLNAEITRLKSELEDARRTCQQLWEQVKDHGNQVTQARREGEEAGEARMAPAPDTPLGEFLHSMRKQESNRLVEIEAQHEREKQKLKEEITKLQAKNTNQNTWISSQLATYPYAHPYAQARPGTLQSIENQSSISPKKRSGDDQNGWRAEKRTRTFQDDAGSYGSMLKENSNQASNDEESSNMRPSWNYRYSGQPASSRPLHELSSPSSDGGSLHNERLVVVEPTPSTPSSFPKPTRSHQPSASAATAQARKDARDRSNRDRTNRDPSYRVTEARNGILKNWKSPAARSWANRPEHSRKILDGARAVSMTRTFEDILPLLNCSIVHRLGQGRQGSPKRIITSDFSNVRAGVVKWFEISGEHLSRFGLVWGREGLLEAAADGEDDEYEGGDGEEGGVMVE